jgi:hypothetical protein
MTGFLFTIIMGILFFQGIPGTFTYHRLIKQWPDPEIKQSDMTPYSRQGGLKP